MAEEEVITQVLTNDEKDKLIGNMIRHWARLGGTKASLVAHLEKQGVTAQEVESKLDTLKTAGKVRTEMKEVGTRLGLENK